MGRIKQIPKEIYINIMNGTYNRHNKYIKKVNNKVYKDYVIFKFDV
jgi:hypothetical protein